MRVIQLRDTGLRGSTAQRRKRAILCENIKTSSCGEEYRTDNTGHRHIEEKSRCGRSVSRSPMLTLCLKEAIERNQNATNEDVSRSDIRREDSYEQPEDQRHATIEDMPEKVGKQSVVRPVPSELTHHTDASRTVYGHRGG